MSVAKSAPRSARNRRWVVAPPAPPAFLAAQTPLAPLVATLLHQRGIDTPEAIERFLLPDYRRGMHDPFLLKGMDIAVQRIAAAIEGGETMAVYGDFDTDGVTAVTLLMQAIAAMGGEIQPYIPHRVSEGYGLNTEAIDALTGRGVKLLITVDCGISNRDEVAHAAAAGLDVIVTDHHTPPAELPPALAVINPKQPGCAYPFKQLVGVGIAYKLVQALVRRGLTMPLRGRDLLDVVALGTVADMGPLIGENRVLVKAGLESINTTSRAGLRALIVTSGLVQGKITAGDIGFGLGPRLNAAGRIDSAVRAYQLLLAEDPAVAKQIAEALSADNRQRQQLTKDVQAAALGAAEASGKRDNQIVVLDDASYPSGIVGLVAARLVEDLGRPVIIIERQDPVSRGSARSIPGFNILDALTSCADLFVRYGGHAAAAGFSIPSDQIDELDARVNAYAAHHLTDDLLVPSLAIDAELSLSALSQELMAQLATLEPFGQGNPRPLLMSQRVHVDEALPRGADGSHLKLRLSDGQGGPSVEAIAFRLGHLAAPLQRHRWIDVAYHLEINEWNGKQTLQLNVRDFRRA